MQEVLRRIKPNKEERELVQHLTTEFLLKLRKRLKHAEPILGGSGAKGTWLSGNHDVDIFVAFEPTKVNPAAISMLLESSLHKAFPKEKILQLHGSRDYFQICYQKINFEIVPILKIKKAKDAQNITDVSPLHSLWVNKRAKKVKDDILLAKQFCKAQGFYGAESYIGGFSGYVLEILVVHYGSFKKLLQAALKWKEKEVIDAEKHYRSAPEALFHINRSKLHSPLIVVDPVDKTRNAAAALSKEKFMFFKEQAQQYLKQKHAVADFFEKKSLDVAAIKGGRNAVLFEITPLEGKQDVVGVKIMKAFEFLKQKLAPFQVKEARWEWNENAILYFRLGRKELPEMMIHAGPPLSLAEHVTHFQKKNKDTFIEKGRIMARIKVAYPQLADFVKVLLREKYLLERVQEIKLL